MRALFFIKDPTARDMLAFFLESQFNAKTEVATAAGQTEEQATVDVVIADAEAMKIGLAQSFLDAKEKPLLLTISKLPLTDMPGVETIHPENLLPELEAHLQRAISKGRFPKVDATRVGFCRIRTTLLARVSPLKADIYIRLSEVKYVKLFRQGDVFDSKDVERYAIQKKQEYLHLRKAETAEFIEKFSKDLDLLLSAKIPAKKAGEVAVTIHETVRELGNAVGFTPQIQEMAKKGVKLAQASIGNNPGLKDLFAHLAHDREKYLSSHSLAVAHLACTIAMASDWPSETTFQKLTFAGYFHDIVFTNQELCRLRSLDELEAMRDHFTPEEHKLYKNHPILVSDMMKKFREIPSDVDVIILQHHEKADGSGFPKHLQGAYISPLSTIFIVAHELVDFLLDRPQTTEDELSAFLENFKTNYGFATFKKILASIERSGLVREMAQLLSART